MNPYPYGMPPGVPFGAIPGMPPGEDRRFLVHVMRSSLFVTERSFTTTYVSWIIAEASLVLRLRSIEWLSRLQTHADASLTTGSSQQCTCPTSSGSSTNAAKAIRQACCPASAPLW